jgi:hypothetical protein
MALQTSGAISINNLRTEFGDTPGSDSLSEYYRGGAYVPNITQNNSIPTGGTIRLSNFYGAVSAEPIPWVDSMRRSISQPAINSSRSVTDGIAHAYVRLAFRFRNVDGRSFVLEARETYTPPITLSYSTSGFGSALSTTFRQVGRFQLPTSAPINSSEEIALDWSTSGAGGFGTVSPIGTTSGTLATYAAQDNVYRSVSVGQSIGLLFRADLIAECFSNFSSSPVMYLRVKMKKTGWLDTEISVYSIRAQLTARSTACF